MPRLLFQDSVPGGMRPAERLTGPHYAAFPGVFAMCCHGKFVARQQEHWAPSVPISIRGRGKPYMETLGKLLSGSQSLPEGMSRKANVGSCQILCLSCFCQTPPFGNSVQHRFTIPCYLEELEQTLPKAALVWLSSDSVVWERG